MEAASAISTLMPTASAAPAWRSDSTAASSAGRPRAITATAAPSAAKVRAMASPIPLLPPVTTACDPARPKSIVAPFVSAATGDVVDRFRRHAQAAQAETKDLFADFGAVALAGRPLSFGSRPHDGLHRLGVGHRVDVDEHPVSQSPPQLF